MTAPNPLTALPRTLKTQRLTLREPLPDDAPQTFDGYAQDKEVTRYLSWPPHRSVSETGAFLEWIRKENKASRQRAWSIQHNATDGIIGMIDVRRHGPGLETGYVLGRAHWGCGYMTEALKALVQRALTLPDVHRFQGVCDVDNPASGRVMEKAGLQFEGVLRRYARHPNVSQMPRDCRLYAAIKV